MRIVHRERADLDRLSSQPETRQAVEKFLDGRDEGFFTMGKWVRKAGVRLASRYSEFLRLLAGLVNEKVVRAQLNRRSLRSVQSRL
jgi:hypothetical protein